MATLKQRLHRKNANGAYDTIHLETSADLVLMTDGTTKLSDKISSMDTAIAGKAASSHTHAAQTSVTGNAGTATKLATARSIQTNLASTSAASFNGTANITPGITGVLSVANGGTGVTSLAELKAALGISSGGISSDALTDVPTIVGSSYQFANYDWTIVHVTNNLVYAILTEILEFTEYSYGDEIEYAESLLVSHCEEFQNTLANENDLACLEPVSVRGVTLNVFVPTYDQMDGGWSWFDRPSRRIAKYGDTTYEYWTSSQSYNGDIWVVGTDGGLYSNSPGNSGGFRPCIAFKR